MEKNIMLGIKNKLFGGTRNIAVKREIIRAALN